jgi:dGTPase
MNHDLDDAVRSGIIPAIPKEFLALGASHGRRVGAMVLDVVQNSLGQPAIRLSPTMLALMNALKEWLYENVYLEYPRRYPDIEKAKHIVKSLFEHYLAPGALPPGYAGVQGAIDYVAGMTDRFAIDQYRELHIPSSFDERIRTLP